MLDEMIEPMATLCLALALTGAVLMPKDSEALTQRSSWHPNRAEYLRTVDIPSHEGRYQASLAFDAMGQGDAWGGVVTVRTAQGAPVTGVRLALETSMPDSAAVPITHPVFAGELGDGRYRVLGMKFDRAGWHTVRLVIDAAGAGDSLAFNLIR